MIQIKKTNLLLIKYLPYIVLLGVVLCSILAFKIGANVVCLRSGGDMLINLKCTILQVQDLGICKENYVSDKYYLMTQANYTINITQ